MSRESSNIHPTAIVHEEAILGKNVRVGPYCIIGPRVSVGDNTEFKSHVNVDGLTEIGENNTFFQFCSIGAPPQDLSYKEEDTKVIIGNGNTIREYVSIHRGTTKQDGITQLGNDGLVMAYVHIGHDVRVGNNVVLVNSVNLAGHVNIGDKCIISGGTNISQFVTIGEGTFIGGLSGVDRDIPPFCTCFGNRIRLKGINIIGLRRQGHSKQSISELVDFYRSVEASALSPRAFVDHEELTKEYLGNKLIERVIEFIKSSQIGIAPFIA